MSFATIDDLIEQFGRPELVQRTDRTNKPATTLDESVAQLALDQASSLAESYVAKRCTLPLPVVPKSLTKATADIARYYLWSHTAKDDSPVRLNHDAALRWLKDISNGVVTLDLGDGLGEPEPAGGGAVRFASGDRVFTGSSLKGYV